jgi:hypothetical protein
LPGAGASVPYEGLLLPDSAIASNQSRKIGPLDDGLRVIREGLKSDDRVIVQGRRERDLFGRLGGEVRPRQAVERWRQAIGGREGHGRLLVSARRNV